MSIPLYTFDTNLNHVWFFFQDEKLDLSFLQHIREVTGYVLISHVDVTRIILPSLQIIRGRTLFKLNVHDDEFALIVTLSKMHNLELPALRGKTLLFFKFWIWSILCIDIDFVKRFFLFIQKEMPDCLDFDPTNLSEQNEMINNLISVTKKMEESQFKANKASP